MQPLRYSLNLTLDGCYDHTAVTPDESLHRHSEKIIARADALILGRVTYQMMESAWREPGHTGVKADWMEDWMLPFARRMDGAKKYVVSSTLAPAQVNWNSELLTGDLGSAIQALKQKSGRGLYVGGVQLAQALTELGLIDEYEWVVHPTLAGHGPYLFSGLTQPLDLKLTNRLELASGAVALTYEPRHKR